MLSMRVIAYFIFSVVFSSVSAQPMEVPEGVKVVTAPEVRKMVTNNEALLIHTLSQIEFQMQHIPSSINIPVDEVENSSLMPSDKNTAIIFYCNGEACPYSRRAAEIAIQKGYKNIYWFKGGILAWRKYQYKMEVNKELNDIKVEKYSPDEFQELMQSDAFILDVRPQWWRESEVQAGVIMGTDMIIPLLNLHKHLDLLPRERPILLVDRVMRQTPHAAKFLVMNGFKVIGILKGGTRRWVSEGRPVLEPKDEPTIVGSL